MGHMSGSDRMGSVIRASPKGTSRRCCGPPLPIESSDPDGTLLVFRTVCLCGLYRVSLEASKNRFSERKVMRRPANAQIFLSEDVHAARSGQFCVLGTGGHRAADVHQNGIAVVGRCRCTSPRHPCSRPRSSSRSRCWSAPRHRSGARIRSRSLSAPVYLNWLSRTASPAHRQRLVPTLLVAAVPP